MLIKHSIILILLTILILCVRSSIQVGLGLWIDLEFWLAHYLDDIFSSGGMGGWFKRVLTFLAVPLVVTFLPAGIYWCFKRKAMPYLKEIFWLLWIIQAMIFCLDTSFFVS